jgi:hypothetical protein
MTLLQKNLGISEKNKKPEKKIQKDTILKAD